MPFNESYLQEYNQMLAEYLAENKKFQIDLPPPDISRPYDLAKWYKITENKLNQRKQYSLLKQKFRELHEAYIKLVGET